MCSLTVYTVRKEIHQIRSGVFVTVPVSKRNQLLNIHLYYVRCGYIFGIYTTVPKRTVGKLEEGSQYSYRTGSMTYKEIGPKTSLLCVRRSSSGPFGLSRRRLSVESTLYSCVQTHSVTLQVHHTMESFLIRDVSDFMYETPSP